MSNSSVEYIREKRLVFLPKSTKVNSNVMWNKMTNCIRHVAKEQLGESKGMAPPNKDTSWWNKEVKTTIKNK